MTMRKACIVFLVLLVAVSCCFAALHGLFLGVSDDVTVTRQTLYGDPAAAEGVNILVRNHYEQYLMWETSLTLGVNAVPETEFTFSNDRISLPGETVYTGVKFNSLTNVFVFDNKRLPETAGEKYTSLVEALTNAVEAVPVGEKKSFTVDLSEYLEYYPLEGQIILPGITVRFSEFEYWTEDSAETARKFNDFFKIPVDTTFSVEYEIDKRYSGSSYGAYIESNYHINAEGTATADACYFTFNTVMEDGQIADTSLIPGGYGIYRLPYEKDVGVDMDNLEMVYALDPAEKFDSLSLSKDGKRLRLHTWKGEDLMLTVIDIATMTQVQKVKLLTDTENSYYNVVSYDDFVLIEENRYNSDSLDRIMVWEELADGTYSQAISAPINAEVFPEGANLNLFYQYENAVDYADGKLVVLRHRMERQESYWYDNLCGLYVAVYDATGMLYAGTCEWNLSQVNAPDPYGIRVEPLYDGSMEVSW